MTNHYRRAEELLDEAARLEDTPRHSVAKTLATMAQAHATLALVKATRQTSLCGRPFEALDGRTYACTLPAGHLDGSERPVCMSDRASMLGISDDAEPDTTTFAPGMAAPTGDEQPRCKCQTGERGEVCPTHDVSLFESGAWS